MIPLLALGVPGDITTAIIPGAFMIHGLRRGPLMFLDNISLNLRTVYRHYAELDLFNDGR